MKSDLLFASVMGLFVDGMDYEEFEKFQAFEKEWEEAEAAGRLEEWLHEKAAERDAQRAKDEK